MNRQLRAELRQIEHAARTGDAAGLLGIAVRWRESGDADLQESAAELEACAVGLVWEGLARRVREERERARVRG